MGFGSSKFGLGVARAYTKIPPGNIRSSERHYAPLGDGFTVYGPIDKKMTRSVVVKLFLSTTVAEQMEVVVRTKRRALRKTKRLKGDIHVYNPLYFPRLKK